MACTINITIEELESPGVAVTGSETVIVVEQCAPASEDSGPPTWDEITGKPSTFEPSAHTHPISDVTGLQTALDGKADDSHGHEISDVTGLQTALDGKAPTSHSHAISDVTGLQTALDDKADLVGGVIPTDQIPAIAVSEFLGEAASQVDMLALTGQRGDWCIRTDVNRTYFLIADDASILANWRYIETPASPVTSVNGQTGVVVLAKSDVGLGNVDNTSDANKPVSTAQQTALDGKANTSHTHAISDVTNLQASLDDKANKNALFDPRNRTEWVEEFMTGGSETGEIGSHNWEAISANSGSTTAQAATAGHPGVYRLTCGTTSAAGRSTLYCGQSVVQLGGGAIEIECGINIGQVPDGTNTFTIEAGLGDTPSGTTTDGVYFLFDRAVSTTNWLARSVSNSVGDQSDTGVAIATGWVAFKIVIDANATEVKYYINGSLVATRTSDIPSASGRSCAPQFKVIGSAGTGANRYIDADYFKFCQIFSTPR